MSMPTQLLTIAALATLTLSIGIVILVRKHPKPPTPFQQIFQDAHDLIQTHGLMVGNFVQRGHNLGDPVPHCVLGAIAASDPSYMTREGIYSCDGNGFFRDFCHNQTGQYPEVINDRDGKDTILALLLEARDAAA